MNCELVESRNLVSSRFVVEKMVEVRWVEPGVGSDGWKEVEEAELTQITECVSVGFLVVDDEENVVLALSRCNGGAVSQVLAIPRQSVIKVKELGIAGR